MTREHISEQANFINSFWGPSKEAGFRVIQTKIHHGLTTLKELKEFYEERILVEKEYSKRLEKLVQKTDVGSHDTGSLKEALDKMQAENLESIKINEKLQSAITHQNLDKLNVFSTMYKKKVLKIESHMTKLVSRRMEAFKQYQQCKFKYRDECGLIKSYRLQAQASWGGKEVEKIQAKLNKLLSSIDDTRNKYMRAVEQIQEVEDSYVRDWSTMLRDLYLLEAERIQVCKVNSFTFFNNIATMCVEYDQSAERARSSIAQINPSEDLQLYGYLYATGNQIYTPPQFIEFMDGLDEKPEGIDFQIANFELPPFLARSQSMYSQRKSQPSSPIKDQFQINEPSPKSQQQSPITAKSKLFNNLQSKPQEYTPISYRTLNPSSSPSAGSPQKKSYPDAFANFGDESTSTHNKLGSPTESPEKALERLNLPPPTMGKLTSNSELTRKAPTSNYSSTDSEDVFSESGNYTGTNDKFASSQGSNSSQPTQYTTSSVYSTTSSSKNWATPRRKEELLRSKMQEKINRNTKELPTFPPSNEYEDDESGFSFGKSNRQQIPIQKDFSIDFIAKALEDLNSGGDGDVNAYRRSVRKDRERKSMTAPTTLFEPSRRRKSVPENVSYHNRSKSAATEGFFEPRLEVDFIDDHDEVATRYGSGNHSAKVHDEIRRPKSMYYEPSTKNFNPRSLFEEPTTDSHFDTPKSKETFKATRSFSKTPTKSYTNLFSFIQDSPSKVVEKNDNGLTPSGKRYICKVKTMYSYKPQHHGELGFKKGTKMYVLNKQEDNWFVCEVASEPNAGTMGLVPGNYVKEVVF